MAFTFTLISGLVLAGALAACVAGSPVEQDIGAYSPPSIEHAGRSVSMDEMISEIHSARAVLVGESHDRFDHHLNQLEIIKRLHGKNPDLAIGMEQFQQPFQRYLDAYIEGSIGVDEMLIETEYYTRWTYEYRLYEPILSYAREHRIPLVALNLPAELTRKVAAEGLSGLSEEEAAQVPPLDRSDTEYEERLRRIYEQHPSSGKGRSFENFYTAQLLWDEGMAARAARYLAKNPGVTMVVLAGRGHIDYGSGIPDRLARRIDGGVVTVTQDGKGDDSAALADNVADNVADDVADYVLQSRPVEAPQRGLIGVRIDASSSDGVPVMAVREEGAGQAAGIREGDVIVAINQYQVGDIGELRARMWDKRPGDQVTVAVRRGEDEIIKLDVTLR